MSRSIFAFFVALAVLQAASAVDISKYKSVRLEFNESHMVLKTKLLGGGDERASGFIGDLFVGQRYADEIVFRRVVEFDNPTNTVQTTSLNLSITNGVIHYVSARNNPGSYAVACNDPSSLGSSQSSIHLRVPPNSKSMLTLTIAAHNQVYSFL
ncbi:PREDICTED: uncharacterized protein LOC107194523 [Dufourea novaeangliae]|uniref:uncharacterized protein LOC107194523 n=1 Tax=Dufourea novaeangliae TaxID=178035 RepID=UPI000767D59B|nr:PREDICTED: uncharacterized protein LOC107194523 [Dufourea novaeangliae]